jgi:hygromycin-B 7''-O-kinase
MRLPTGIGPREFDEKYRTDPESWLDAVREVCAAHALPFDSAVPFADGSNLVASVGRSRVVKLFPPFHRNQWESERRVLARLAGRVRVPIPELIAAGERDDHFTYVILSELPGTTLEKVWPGCTPRQKASLLERIGAMMAEVHSVPVGELADLDPAWSTFLGRQVAGCRARHARLGMPPWLVEGVERYVGESLALLPTNIEPVILTGEYTPFNLLVEERADGWEFTGMIDFGDAMIGHHEYDLLGPAVFLGEGSADLVRCLLRGYGLSHPEHDRSLRGRLMALQILHRYSNFEFQVRIDGWKSRAADIGALSELLFPF